MTRRIGVLGGMFDPVHRGHIAAAIHAADSLCLAAVKLVPCGIPNHRRAAIGASLHRVAMLQSVLEIDDRLEIDRIEIDRPGTSYAEQTLRLLKAQSPQDRFVFILGIDAFNGITLWYNWQQLMGLCHFLVLHRDGENVRQSTAIEMGLQHRLVTAADDMFQHPAGKVMLDNEFASPGSSTEVRARLAAGDDMGDLLHPAVASYIHKHNLYTEQVTDSQSE